MNRRLLASFLAILMTAAVAATARAADCGDTAGPGGSRVACFCGDTVVTSTTLRTTDPVVTALCLGPGLSIGADGITLNCNGRQMNGDLTDSGILLDGRTGVTVRSCKIADFSTGIDLLASSGNRLLSSSIGVGTFGIRLQLGSDGNLIRGNRLTVENGGDAINLAEASGNQILTNILEGVLPLSGDGIDLDGPANDNAIRGNVITGFGGSGVELDLGGGNVIAENISSGNGIGVRVATFEANTIERNTTDDNEADGLDICCEGHTVDRNRARRNGFNGITVLGDSNTVTRNTADDNLGNGIGVDGGENTVDRNRGRGNSINGLEVIFGSGNRITRNAFDENVEDGILVDAEDSIIDGNRGQRNGDDGLEVAGFGNTVSNNTFDFNGDWGICAGAGNTDGGGNRAKGNLGGQISFDC
jgi:hypothetical protein